MTIKGILYQILLFLKEFITHKPLHKILAVILAIFLWFQAASDISKVRRFDVHIDYSKLPDSTILISNKTDYEFSILVEATVKELIRLSLANLKYNIDLNKYDLGKHSIEINDFSFLSRYRANVKNIDLNKNSIDFYLDKVVSKKVPVNLPLKNELQENLIWDKKKFDISPDLVSLKGPASILKDIDTVFSEELDLNQISYPGIKTLKLLPIPDVSVSPTSVNVNYYIKVLEKRELYLPIEVILLDEDNYQIDSFSPQNVMITCFISNEYKNRVKFDNVRATATLNLPREGLNNGKISISNLPSYIVKYYVEPEIVKINLNKKVE